MKTALLRFFLVVLPLLSCEGPPRDPTLQASTPVTDSTVRRTAVSPGEEYIMVTTATTLPFYVSHDQTALKAWGKARGVKVTIVGPPDWDVPAQIAAIEQVIVARPAGLLINGTDPGLAGVINRAVEAGIPTVVYDSDIPHCRRHCFLGSDWYQMGYKQGQAVVRLTGGRGKVAALGILGMSNQEDGFRGLQDALKGHPGLEFVGKFECKNTIEESARVTTDLATTYPDLAAVCGFTSETGAGIALGLKETGKTGKVKITNVDAEPVLLRLMKEGAIQYLVEQKREVFIWYGAQFLFDMVHNHHALPGQYLRAGAAAAPYSVNTGLIEIGPHNIDAFLSGQ